MNNAIRLLRGERKIENRSYKAFKKGDTICGIDSEPEELKRWSISEEQVAKKELEKYRCEYQKGLEMWYVKEYALEYFEAGEDGEFLFGSDFELAKE